MLVMVSSCKWNLKELRQQQSQLKLSLASKISLKTGFKSYFNDIIFDGALIIEPGEDREVSVRFALHQLTAKHLYVGRFGGFRSFLSRVGQ